MKRIALVALLLSFAASACGLKVPATLGPTGGGGLAGSSGTIDTAAGPVDAGPVTDTVAAGGAQNPQAPLASQQTSRRQGSDTVSDLAQSIFASETEGVTKDELRLCTHVPITGAAPIARHANRFGQFYWDDINKKGGVYGRKVRFLAFDDGYYPAGARAAIEKCAREGAFIYFGAAGTDQIASVAQWAERKQVPYFHGPVSDKDLKGYKYNVFTGPTYEDQHRLLADYLVKRFGKHRRYGMIRVNSPYFDHGHKAYVEQLQRHGVKLVVDKVVQKDERQFADVYYELTTKQVEIINNFSTPNIWINMLQQKPSGYSPTWTAVSPVAGYNIVAVALANSNSKAVVFHHFNPACNCTDYQTDLDTKEPWAADEKRFLELFKKYSPEQTPRPDDFDYSSYLSAKSIHRILLALGPQPTRTKLFKLLETYKEAPKATFPGCAADYTRANRRGGWKVNVFELKVGKWKQVESCADHA